MESALAIPRKLGRETLCRFDISQRPTCNCTGFETFSGYFLCS